MPYEKFPEMEVSNFGDFRPFFPPPPVSSGNFVCSGNKLKVVTD